MADELRIGSRVASISHEAGTLLALHTNSKGEHWAWVEWDDGSYCYGCELFSLTRIEPDVPQPKFRVGQSVTLRGMRGTVETVCCKTTYTYDIRWPAPGTDSRNCQEDQLEPVPEVCPKCGGKVGDG